LKRNKHIMIPYQSLLRDKQTYDVANLMIYNNYTTKRGKIIADTINIYLTSFYEIKPYLILWATRDIYYYDQYLAYYIAHAMKTDKRYIFIKLTLIPNDMGTHANCLIYDREYDHLIRFEPYGPASITDNDKLNDMLRDIAHMFNKTTKYIAPYEYLNYSRFQTASSESDPEFRLSSDPVGFCLAWTYWFIELYTAQPANNVQTLTKLVNSAFDHIIDKYKAQPSPLLYYIRSYAMRLDKHKQKFMKTANIANSQHYLKTYSDDTLDKIITLYNTMINTIMS